MQILHESTEKNEVLMYRCKCRRNYRVFSIQLIVGVCLGSFFKVSRSLHYDCWIYFNNYRKISTLPCFSLKYLIISHLAIIRYCITPATLNEVKKTMKIEINLLHYQNFLKFSSNGQGEQNPLCPMNFKAKHTIAHILTLTTFPLDQGMYQSLVTMVTLSGIPHNFIGKWYIIQQTFSQQEW